MTNNVENSFICLFDIHVSFSFIDFLNDFSVIVSLIPTLIFISFLHLFWVSFALLLLDSLDGS